MASSSQIGKRLPRILPRTISESRRSVISNKTKVRRSFSRATALAADRAEKNRNNASINHVSS